MSPPECHSDTLHDPWIELSDIEPTDHNRHNKVQNISSWWRQSFVLYRETHWLTINILCKEHNQMKIKRQSIQHGYF